MSYLAAHPGDVAVLAAEHVGLVAAALAIALAIAFPLGILAARRRAAGDALIAALSALYTIPSLALLGLLVAAFGLGTPTALVALVVYAQMLLVRGIATGVRGVPPAVVEAARGLGMTPRQTLLRVELPLALPVIVGGIRVATVTLVALATVAAWIDAGGLGALVFEGLHRDDASEIVAGSLCASAIAVVADLGLRAAERAVRRA